MGSLLKVVYGRTSKHKQNQRKQRKKKTERKKAKKKTEREREEKMASNRILNQRILNIFKARVENVVSKWKKERINHFSFNKQWNYVGHESVIYVAKKIEEEDGRQGCYHVEKVKHGFKIHGKENFVYDFKMKNHKVKVKVITPPSSEEEKEEEEEEEEKEEEKEEKEKEEEEGEEEEEKEEEEKEEEEEDDEDGDEDEDEDDEEAAEIDFSTIDADIKEKYGDPVTLPLTRRQVVLIKMAKIKAIKKNKRTRKQEQELAELEDELKTIDRRGYR